MTRPSHSAFILLQRVNKEAFLIPSLYGSSSLWCFVKSTRLIQNNAFATVCLSCFFLLPLLQHQSSSRHRRLQLPASPLTDVAGDDGRSCNVTHPEVIKCSEGAWTIADHEYKLTSGGSSLPAMWVTSNCWRRMWTKEMNKKSELCLAETASGRICWEHCWHCLEIITISLYILRKIKKSRMVM